MELTVTWVSSGSEIEQRKETVVSAGVCIQVRQWGVERGSPTSA